MPLTVLTNVDIKQKLLAKLRQQRDNDSFDKLLDDAVRCLWERRASNTQFLASLRRLLQQFVSEDRIAVFKICMTEVEEAWPPGLPDPERSWLAMMRPSGHRLDIFYACSSRRLPSVLTFRLPDTGVRMFTVED